MRGPWRRTAVAAALVAAGVIVPCTAWYVAGSRAAHDRSERLVASQLRQAVREAGHLAEQVSRRLEALLDAESRRPFEDYLERTGPGPTHALAGPIDSPRLPGPVDPLVWVHFQVDAYGQLTLPSLDLLARTDEDAEAVHDAIVGELDCASPGHLAALRRDVGEAVPGDRPESPQSGVVTVGPFSWHTATIGAEPALIALREVTMPAAVLTQGFVVRAERLDGLLDGSILPATLRPGAPSSDRSEALVALHGDAWTVTVDAASAVAEARSEAARGDASFVRSFVAGALLAALAGTFVVLLVRQVERVAAERLRFAASAAHELRTPLAGLRLYAEMLGDEGIDVERRRRYAARVADESERLGRVVTNVLGFSRLERSGVELRPQPGDLAAAVRDSVERLRPGLAALGAQVEVVERDALPTARFDADALHQMLQNLLDNAERYSRNSADRSIRVEVAAPDGRPTVAVRDRGRGVPAAMRSRLFRAFESRPDPESPAGLGIGLALVRALAAAQDATVEWVPQSGPGATFEIRFRPAVG